MKLYEFIIIFIFFITPPLINVEARYSYAKETMELNHKYEASMMTARCDSSITHQCSTAITKWL